MSSLHVNGIIRELVLAIILYITNLFLLYVK